MDWWNGILSPKRRSLWLVNIDELQDTMMATRFGTRQQLTLAEAARGERAREAIRISHQSQIAGPLEASADSSAAFTPVNLPS